MNRIINYKLNPNPDTRDYKYQGIFNVAELPKQKNLYSIMPKVYAQGDLGSCVDNSLLTMMQIGDKVMGSRLYAYYKARKVKGEDTGLYVSDACKSLYKYGTCLETSWKYDTTKFAVKPPSKLDKEAMLYRPKEYRAIPQTLQALKSAIVNSHPVAFGLMLKESFQTEQVAKTGIYHPSAGEQTIGGIVC